MHLGSYNIPRLMVLYLGMGARIALLISPVVRNACSSNTPDSHVLGEWVFMICVDSQIQIYVCIPFVLMGYTQSYF